MPRTRVMRCLQALAACLCSGIAGAHPMDPLTADEIIGAANVLLAGGAAQPGAIFQSVELREPPRLQSWGVAVAAAATARPPCSGARTNRASRAR